jgi:hypothetical protein
VLVTSDVADFPDVLREWGMAGRAHAGVILLHGLEDGDFGLVVQGIQRWLRRHPELESGGTARSSSRGSWLRA